VVLVEPDEEERRALVVVQVDLRRGMRVQVRKGAFEPHGCRGGHVIALDGWMEQLTDHGISQEAWEGMSRAEQNAITDPLRQQVVEREHEMVEELEARL
jgi:hypothetical protein